MTDSDFVVSYFAEQIRNESKGKVIFTLMIYITSFNPKLLCYTIAVSLSTTYLTQTNECDVYVMQKERVDAGCELGDWTGKRS